MTESVRIDTVIDGRHVPRAEVLRWEGARITAAADKLGVTVPPFGDIGVRREELLRASSNWDRTESPDASRERLAGPTVPHECSRLSLRGDAPAP